MQSTDSPEKISIPFAVDGTKRPIPNDSQIGIVDGAASFETGFPPKTFTPIAAGGVPPAGADFNGIFNRITDIQRWQCVGGMFKFDAEFASLIGGYPKGSRILGSDLFTVWVSDVDANINNPDINPVGWKSLSASNGASYIGGAGQVVSSIAAVRLLLKTSPSKNAFVTGFYVPGDGGGGSYYLDSTDTTSPDTNGTVIVADDGGRWKLSQTFAPSLTQFGIRQGMSSDQTVAINAVLAIMVGKQLYVTSGDYRVDGELFISGGVRLQMEKNARFWRNSLYSSATTPVAYVIDSYSEMRGGVIRTDNGSPNGAVVLGHKNNADDRNAWYWRFTDMDLQGNGVDGSIGWAVISGQISFPLNANYFGTVQNINTKNFDIGCFFNEDANAHNISNIHFWQCKTANIWLRGAYANNFSNMFFHGASANGCIGIKLSNKAGGPDTNADNNIFVGWTCETGGLLDQAFVIDTECTGNVLIGTSNVAGGYTINNYNNNIQVTNTGVGGKSIPPGGGARTEGVVSRVATPITPTGLLGVGDNGAFLAIVETTLSTNASLNRTDMLLISARNSGFSGSAVTLVSSAFTATGTAGEPLSTTYSLDFSSGAGLPRLTVNLTPTGTPDVIYNVRVTLTKV